MSLSMSWFIISIIISINYLQNHGNGVEFSKSFPYFKKGGWEEMPFKISFLIKMIITRLSHCPTEFNSNPDQTHACSFLVILKNIH